MNSPTYSYGNSFDFQNVKPIGQKKNLYEEQCQKLTIKTYIVSKQAISEKEETKSEKQKCNASTRVEPEGLRPRAYEAKISYSNLMVDLLGYAAHV